MSTDGTIESGGASLGLGYTGGVTVEEFIDIVGLCKLKQWVKECRTYIDFYQLSRSNKMWVYQSGSKHVTLKSVLEYLNIDYD